MVIFRSKDAKKVKNFDITPYTKGFTSTFETEDEHGDTITTNEYFQFREIYQLIHYPDRGVEIVYVSGNRRVFYNDGKGKSLELFNILNDTIISWMDSNRN